MQDIGDQDFWGHLDVLRTILVRVLAVSIVSGIVAFMFKEELFAIVLAPKEADFITYRVLFRIADSLAMGVVFEMPVLAWLFAEMGLISSDFMRH